MLANAGLAPNDNPRIQQAVAANFHADIHIGCLGVEEGNPVQHQLLIDTLAHQAGGCGKLHAVVNPQGFVGIVKTARTDLAPGLDCRFNHIGQIVFTLGIVAAQGR